MLLSHPQSAEQRGNGSSAETHVSSLEGCGLFGTRDAVLLRVGKPLAPPEAVACNGLYSRVKPDTLQIRIA